MRFRRFLFALVLVPGFAFALGAGIGGCGGCGGGAGTLAGARVDARFVTEKGEMFVRTEAGIERVALDGSGRRVVFARPTSTSTAGTRDHWHVLDISPDFTTWALGTDDTDVFVGDMATGVVRQVTALDDRGSAAAFSPDSKRLALGRHSDFTHPASKDDDTLYLVDLATLATVALPPTTDHWPAAIAWSADGSALWVTMNHSQPPQWVTLPDAAAAAPEKRVTGLTAPPSALAPKSPLLRPIDCGRRVEAGRWEPEVRIVDATDAGVVVAHLDGRQRGFHDYQPDFDDATWSPGCGYVIFAYDQRVWAVPAGGGAGPGPIIEGSRITFAP